jgi:hypothetical protein
MAEIHPPIERRFYNFTMRRYKLWLLLGTLGIILALTACAPKPTPATLTRVEATPTPKSVAATPTPVLSAVEGPVLSTVEGPVPPTATPIPPTPTAVPPTASPTTTATLMPTTPPPATEEEPIPSTVSQVPRITPQELKEKLDANQDVIVVDARSRKEYDSVHIPGALSIPLSEVEERQGELPQEGEIVLYCT